MNLPLGDIYNTILGKEDVYLSIINKAHKTENEQAGSIFLAEVETFLTRLEEYAGKEPNATLSIPQGVNIFLEVLTNGLSFSKTANHIYLSRLKGTGTSIGYQVTVDGFVFSAQRVGAIDHLSEPVLVQQGEPFEIQSTPDGRNIVKHTIRFEGRPKFKFDNFVVGYIYIVYPNGDRELSWISKNRLEQYKAKSQNPNLYHDESFIQTKVIKHALRKVRKTDFMRTLMIEDDETIQENRMWEDEQPTPEINTEVSREPF